MPCHAVITDWLHPHLNAIKAAEMSWPLSPG